MEERCGVVVEWSRERRDIWVEGGRRSRFEIQTPHEPRKDKTNLRTGFMKLQDCFFGSNGVVKCRMRHLRARDVTGTASPSPSR
jgi:hypothetical protein